MACTLGASVCDTPGDESTPLLPDPSPKSRTPLPKVQLGLVLLVLFAEAVSVQYIYPFINQLIRELGITGGDDRRIGYYTGFMTSSFYGVQALTSLYWSRLSDYVGRKPILFVCLTGLSISNVCFGLSKSFWMLAMSRGIAGALDGGVGVIKSVMGEITDHTNMARAFACIPAVSSLGTSFGPLYSGAYTKPHEHWPELFSGIFWKQYPYFLPCIITASLSVVILVTIALFLKESLPSKREGCIPRCETTESAQNTVDDDNAFPIPVYALIRTYSVMIAVANYGILAFIDMGCFPLLPLFYASPTEIGGLGFPPAVIGTCLGVFGLFDGVFQMFFVPILVDRCGERRVFRLAVLAFLPLIGLFPVMSLVVQFQQRTSPVMWLLISLQLLSLVVVDMSYAVIPVFTTRAAPNKHSLGTTHGLGQTVVSIARTIGPAMFTSMFAFSKEYNVLGGNLVYLVLGVLTCFLIFLSGLLPDLRNNE